MRKQYHSRLVGADTHVWDVHRLARLAQTLPTQPVALSAIAELDENWWYQASSEVPSPRAIAAHIALVNATDLSHPIILCAEGRLMDGMHRLVKALLARHRTIDAVRFAQTPEPDFVNVSLDDLPYGDEIV
ncbi:hypothetical protein [Shimia sp.]|uniref:hypothetical protein n=1 Tax=Shimia sp. TaxID=1954381 RepID=UPI003296D71E